MLFLNLFSCSILTTINSTSKSVLNQDLNVIQGHHKQFLSNKKINKRNFLIRFFRFLRVNLNWKGIMLDGRFENLNISLIKEAITYSNVVEILQKYQVKPEFDFLSEDTDYADYWILEAILAQFSPKIVVHEVNQQPPHKCVTVPRPSELKFWDGSNFHGASVCAFYCLAKRFDYTMVYCETVGVNCFWIRNDVLKKHLKINSKEAQDILTPQYLFRQPKFEYRNTQNIWEVVTC